MTIKNTRKEKQHISTKRKGQGQCNKVEVPVTENYIKSGGGYINEKIKNCNRPPNKW